MSKETTKVIINLSEYDNLKAIEKASKGNSFVYKSIEYNEFCYDKIKIYSKDDYVLKVSKEKEDLTINNEDLKYKLKSLRSEYEDFRKMSILEFIKYKIKDR